MKKLFSAFSMLILCLLAVVICPQKTYATDILLTPPSADIADPGDLAYIAPVAAVPSAPVVNPAMTYIDVDIANQTLTYFVNGNVALYTPCVTGSPGRGTPRGLFQINSCIPGKYLNGPSWHVWVDRWMRFYGSCGIHDAKWRKSFGGDIYLKNGSHGCVNIPHDQAVALYNMVGIGTTVYVH
ncbi:MAG: L,D-transpeptidase [Lachnospiraceae bacterium]|nr:L,D-transpeptidase [Lachnospiraceae bacterium]